MDSKQLEVPVAQWVPLSGHRDWHTASFTQAASGTVTATSGPPSQEPLPECPGQRPSHRDLLTLLLCVCVCVWGPSPGLPVPSPAGLRELQVEQLEWHALADSADSDSESHTKLELELDLESADPSRSGGPIRVGSDHHDPFNAGSESAA